MAFLLVMIVNDNKPLRLVCGILAHASGVGSFAEHGRSERPHGTAALDSIVESMYLLAVPHLASSATINA
jgi:hypothetical protein